jgi:hypothetical protein
VSPLMPKVITNDWQYASTADIADDTAVEVAAAPAADQRHYVAAVQVLNTDTAVGTIVQVLHGSTVIGNLFVGPYVAAAPGTNYAQATYPKPLKGAAGAAINVKCVTTSAQVRVAVQGFTATA